MSRIVSSSLGTAVWRAGLADPYLHWRRGKSAWEMEVAWESQRTEPSGLPPEVCRALGAHEAFRAPELLLGIVEHRVALDTSKTPSQNDLWCMLKTETGLASVAVEAKAGEDFDKPIGEWLGKDNESASKRRRLTFRCDILQTSREPNPELRYQLFHRAASAILEARRWRAPKALMLVQSFKESPTSWSDYAAFVALFGLSAQRDAIAGPARLKDADLYFAWVDSPLASDAVTATAV